MKETIHELNQEILASVDEACDKILAPEDELRAALVTVVDAANRKRLLLKAKEGKHGSK